jgi:peptidoglycan/xylan/chitin deacetylase (PgdA/CDA1 family)
MTVPASARDGSKDRNGLETLVRQPRNAVLAYHEISTETPGYQYALNCRQFEDHLQLASLLNHRSAPDGERLVISFDDGHISNYACALPLLEKHCCKATFFVIAGRIGQRKDFMTWKHLAELVSLGHRVEAHGWSHIFLTTCPDYELRMELKRSKETLEDRLGVAVRALSAPHGRWNTRVLRGCEDAGYQRLYSSNPWGRGRVEQGVQVMGRLVVVQSMTAERLRHWLTMGRTQVALHRTRQGLKDSARHLLGDKLYYQVWSRFAGWSGPEDYAADA